MGNKQPALLPTIVDDALSQEFTKFKDTDNLCYPSQLSELLSITERCDAIYRISHALKLYPSLIAAGKLIEFCENIYPLSLEVYKGRIGLAVWLALSFDIGQMTSSFDCLELTGPK